MMSDSKEQHKSNTVFFVAFLVAVSWVFRDAIASIVQSWQQEEYSYGYLIPLVTLVLLLNKIEDARIVPRNSWLGCGIVLFSITAQFFFLVAGIRGILPELYMLSIIGLFILFLGTGSARPLAGPLLLLMFAVPLPKFVYYTLSYNMQKLSTSFGVFALEALGVPVFQDGNIIDLGGYKLQVAEACSGLRYLFPLLGLSFLLAYMYQASLLKRALLFASALPIAIAMNGLRIALIGITVDRWGARMAKGFIHDAEGWVVFLGCAACLILEIRIFQSIGRRGALNFDCLRFPKSFYVKIPAPGKPVYASALIVLIGVLGSALMPAMFPDFLKVVPLRQSFASFPQKLGPWVGRFGSLDAESLSHLGTDDYLLADYVKPNTPPVNLYALYYPRQDSTSNEVEHIPTVCIPAGGWNIDSATTKTLALNAGGTLAVNRVIVSKNAVRQVVYYWFIQSGHATLNPYTSRLYMVNTAFAQRRTNGAMVRVVTMITGRESEDDADRRLTGFLRDALGALNGFMFPEAAER
jgi:exosortase D (VPLPA-CTERM-specific)